MPTYQYACTGCDERLEAVQSFSDAPLTDCPACGDRLRKVFSAVGVVFKGSGFYKTDSRSAPKGAGSGDKGDKGDKAGAAATSGTDSSAGSSSTGSSSGSSDGGSSAKPAAATSAPASKTA